MSVFVCVCVCVRARVSVCNATPKILELYYGDDDIEAVKDELNKVYYIYMYCYTKVPNCV